MEGNYWRAADGALYGNSSAALHATNLWNTNNQPYPSYTTTPSNTSSFSYVSPKEESHGESKEKEKERYIAPESEQLHRQLDAQWEQRQAIQRSMEARWARDAYEFSWRFSLLEKINFPMRLQRLKYWNTQRGKFNKPKYNAKRMLSLFLNFRQKIAYHYNRDPNEFSCTVSKGTIPTYDDGGWYYSFNTFFSEIQKEGENTMFKKIYNMVPKTKFFETTFLREYTEIPKFNDYIEKCRYWLDGQMWCADELRIWWTNHL